MRIRQGDVRDWPFIFALGKTVIPASISPWRKQPMEETLKFREGILKGFWTWIQQSDSKVFIAEDQTQAPAHGEAGAGVEGEEDNNTQKLQPIGYLVLYTSSREELTGVIQGWVMDLGVLPERRGKGAGRALLQAAEDYCREHGIPYLGLAVSSHNVKALRLYEHFGFAEERKLLVKVLD